jgi:uncharacterized protein YjaG (DUF416 family)
MNEDLLQDIDGYLKLLGSLCRRWTHGQRTAFLAALAERWLPAYSQFTEAEEWGDADTLRQVLDVVWGHVSGEPVSPSTLDRLGQSVVAATPSMDEFDAFDAMTACQLLGLAIESCAPGAKWQAVTEAAAAAYTAVAEPVDGYPLDLNANRAMWHQPAVRSEIGHQFRLMQQVAAVPVINQSVAAALRRTNRSEPGAAPDRGGS